MHFEPARGSSSSWNSGPKITLEVALGGTTFREKADGRIGWIDLLSGVVRLERARGGRRAIFHLVREWGRKTSNFRQCRLLFIWFILLILVTVVGRTRPVNHNTNHIIKYYPTLLFVTFAGLGAGRSRPKSSRLRRSASVNPCCSWSVSAARVRS